GQPRYDEFARPTASREELRRALGLARDEFCVLFATQPTQHPRYVTDVATAILEVPTARLLLRPHPSLPSSALPTVRTGDRARIVRVAEPAIADLLEACDLLVTQHSTVAIEAALRNRAVITADFTGMPPVVNYAAVGLSTHATTKEALRELIAAHAARGSLGPDRHPGPEALHALEALIGPRGGGASRRRAVLTRGWLVDGAIWVPGRAPRRRPAPAAPGGTPPARGPRAYRCPRCLPDSSRTASRGARRTCAARETA